jgi:hypothetical protein
MWWLVAKGRPCIKIFLPSASVHSAINSNAQTLMVALSKPQIYEVQKQASVAKLRAK